MTTPDKKCCHAHCINSRVTFEDAVIAITSTWRRGRMHQLSGTYFGFYCQTCRDEDSRIYDRFKSEHTLDRFRGPDIEKAKMVLLEIEEEQYPSHAQERLAIMRLTPETFYHPDIGIKGMYVTMVYCKPPLILENVNGKGNNSP